MVLGLCAGRACYGTLLYWRKYDLSMKIPVSIHTLVQGESAQLQGIAQGFPCCTSADSVTVSNSQNGASLEIGVFSRSHIAVASHSDTSIASWIVKATVATASLLGKISMTCKRA